MVTTSPESATKWQVKNLAGAYLSLP